MMRQLTKPARVLLLAGFLPLILLVAIAATPLPAPWKSWRYSRTVDAGNVDAQRFIGVVLPPEVFSLALPQLTDLRVIDEHGTETPYAVFLRQGSSNRALRPTTLHENSFAPGLYSQVVVELGDKSTFHNSIEIHTSETDFVEWVRVDASDDGHEWRIVQPRAPIFRFQKEGHPGTQVVQYSENNAPFLRIRVLDGEKQFPIFGASILYQTVNPPERAPVPATFTPAAKPVAERSVWTADLSGVAEPISDVKFDVAGPAEFIRSVEVEGSSDEKNWTVYGSGEIFRYHQGDTVCERLSIDVPYGENSLRYWRVEIFNRNDAPLEGVVPHFYSIPRHIIFEQQPGHTYTLLYGQSRVHRPVYDLSRRLNSSQMESAATARLGPEEINADWVDPRPWTEQHDFLLWAMLGVAVLVIGYSALRSLRRSASNPTPSA